MLAKMQALENPEDYQFFVEPKKDNRDIQRIITSYLKKKEKLKAIENGEISI